MKRHLVLLGALALAACNREKKESLPIQTATVERRDIVIDAEATGAVEPINVIEVKSKASGLITRMPVETGTNVRPGDLLVQVDTRDVQNQYDQSFADVRAAQAKLDISASQKRRSDELFKSRIITAQEYEAAQLDYANSQAQLVRARTNLDLAKQRLEDATVRAPVAGTVIEKTVSLGQVITSATGAFGGGTTLLKMADLSKVRARALVTETDIGQIRPGQQATVTVDAYPDRPFVGTVEKIEPQAVVQQSVTMFPVLVSLSNESGLLKPGMNGEVSVLVDRRENVLAVPNDAVRNPREAMQVAPLLGLDPDSVQAQLQAQQRGGAGGRARVGQAGAAGAAGGAAGGAPTVTVSRGEVALTPAAQERVAQRGGQERVGFGSPLPEVTPAQCSAVTAAFAKDTAARARLAALRDRVARGEIDRQQMMGESQAIYARLGVDPMVARACMRRERGANAPGGAAGGQRAGTAGAPGAAGQAGTPVLAGEGAAPVRARPGLVFVQQPGGKWSPRVVRLGASNYDYTEVISGVTEGEKVALLAAATLQAQRQQSNEQFRQRVGGGGLQRTTPAAGAAPAGGTVIVGPGGGGGGGGGGRGRP